MSYSSVRVVAGLALVALTGACATVGVDTEVSAFHTLPANLQGERYAFAPSPDQETSLEYAHYTGLVRERLASLGMVESAVPEAKFAIAFDYSIDDGTVRTVSLPVWGQTGVSSAQTRTTVNTFGNTATANANTTYTPKYGVTGYRTQSTNEYKRRMTFLVVDSAALVDGEVVPQFEATVISEGTNKHLPLIVPKMIDALFKDFPGQSGSVRRAEIPCPECP